MQESAFELILRAGLIVKLVIIVLIFFSIYSWSIIFYKGRFFSKARKESEDFIRFMSRETDINLLNQVAQRFVVSPLSNLFRALSSNAGSYQKKGEVERALRRYESREIAKAEKHLNFLATTASSSPFIGLFGTVWGIMNAFRGIGASGSASLAVVAPGIAEALIATAFGLAAAIPAAIGYNYYLGKSRQMIIEIEDFSEELLAKFVKE